MSPPAPIDVNKIIATLVEKHAEKFFAFGKSALFDTMTTTRTRLKLGYTNYLTLLVKTFSRAKSFFFRDDPVPLYDFYVPLRVALPKADLDETDLTGIVRNAPHSIIFASAGQGKSIFMRHLLLSGVQMAEKLPVFIELRSLNMENKTIFDAIVLFVSQHGMDYGEAHVRAMLKAGHFLILLDGYDEVAAAKKSGIARELAMLSASFPHNWYVVSSRQDVNLRGLDGFSEFSLQPLDITQAQRLISLIPFDTDVKKKFSDELQAQLFEEHGSFLSNPLLLSIMLLTYRRSASIPTKLSIFYSQAYEALFEWHDALKGGFQRRRHTSLDIRDFAQAFSAFCLYSYDRREFQFTKVRAMDIIDKSKILVRSEFSAENFLRDCMQSVCLLVEDGLQITFAHRSFQEYFVAAFIAEADASAQVN
jgi:hypothetical protein